MKTKYKEKIGDYTVIRFIADATVDTEATNEKIGVTTEMSGEEVRQLYMDNPDKLVYALVGPEAENVSDEEAAPDQKKLAELGEHRMLLDGGEYIADYRGVEYHVKKSGKWVKNQITEIGVPLPAGAALEENLTKEQREEIAEQREAARIAGLSAEDKAKEKDAKLYALASETNQRAANMELMGKEFDKLAYFQPKEAEIERLYA